MNMFEHAMLGNAILLFLWFVWLNRYFYTPQNRNDIDNEVRKWF